MPKLTINNITILLYAVAQRQVFWSSTELEITINRQDMTMTLQLTIILEAIILYRPFIAFTIVGI
jgi:hypothetical protein